jgi:gluconokinase
MQRRFPDPDEPEAVLIMGVAGVGKTSVGGSLAARLGWEFHDADDYHSPANVEKMRHGIALDDRDRERWLQTLRQVLDRSRAGGRSTVIACSALKKRYRQVVLGGHRRAHVVHLTAPPDVIRERLERRSGHFMPASLLDSQLRDLDAPDDALVLDARMPVPQQVQHIVDAFGLRASTAEKR